MSQAENVRTTATALPQMAEARKPKDSPGLWLAAWRRLRRNRLSMAALVVLMTIVLLTIAAGPISSRVLHTDPYRTRVTQKYRPPALNTWFRANVLRQDVPAPPAGPKNWLGTDEYGRDTLARLLHAGRVSLRIGVSVMLLSLTIGVTMGLLAGYFGGRVDDVVNAIIQLVVNIPGLFLLILLSTLFVPSINALALIFALLGWPGTARLVRGRVFSERRRDYIDAAIVSGARPPRIMFQHLLPNVSSIVLVIAGFEVGGAILAEAGLSALGFGVRIPTASWGNMLAGSLEYFDKAPHLIVAPGLMIVITVFSVYLLADGVRDALDPRLKNL